ncbi:MAG: hypothetical protein J6V83_00050 [Clostridia bacterium]|nr:hypothetical protein [Clostridia bacterium]MBO7155781.1 hypothetical protein [Clostridia bacterium]
MISTPEIKRYTAPDVNYKEILRYATAKEDARLNALIESSMQQVKDLITYSVVCVEKTFTIIDNVVDFGSFKVFSKSLAKYLTGAKSAIMFVATIGTEIDRLIIKYSKLEPSRALVMQAIGTERVESLANLFMKELKDNGYNLSPRFSPAFGDVPIELQKEFFRLLKPERIGVTLNESLLMSPSKSITAFIAVGK